MSKIYFYNSLSKEKQLFRPVSNGSNEIKIYSCGPTVYNYAHIGNFRSYIVWDVLHRYLEYAGYKVKIVKNITDVGHFTEEDEDQGEDKLEKMARKVKKSPLEVAKFYTEVFIKEEKKLNILAPDYRPKATEEIKSMQKIIGQLLKKGYAYETQDGVYFDTAKFSGYGRLSGNTAEGTEPGARVKINPLKKNPTDFALWKKLVGRNKKHLLWWTSPWGKGFPGWHIECSAMAFRYLGETIDIHTGGRDNIFPHHESEIAQSEAFSGRQFSRFWLHSGLVAVDGKKMSKSLENFYTLRDIEKKGFDPLVFRLWALLASYRKEINFSWQKLEETKLNWQKIVEFREQNWEELIKSGQIKAVSLQKDELARIEILWALAKKNSFYFKLRQFIKEGDQKFCFAMDNDLNTAVAFSILLKMLKLANKKPILSVEKIGALILLEEWNKVLAFLPKIKREVKLTKPVQIEKMLKMRQKAKETGNYQKADQIRKKIENRGYKILDLEGGKWKLKITKK